MKIKNHLRIIKKIKKSLPIHNIKSIIVVSFSGIIILSGIGYGLVHYLDTGQKIIAHNKSSKIDKVTPSKKNSVANIPQYVSGASCQSSQLLLSPVVENSGALSGLSTFYFKFTNISHSICTLYGYPTIKINNITSKGSTGIIGQVGSSLITLTPNSSAYFVFQDPNNTVYDGGSPSAVSTSCFTSTKVEVIPPANTTPVISASKISVCPDIFTTPITTYLGVKLSRAYNSSQTCLKPFWLSIVGGPILQECPNRPPPTPVTLLNITGTTTITPITWVHTSPDTITMQGGNTTSTPIPEFTPTVEYIINLTYTPNENPAPSSNGPNIILSATPSDTNIGYCQATATSSVSGQFSAECSYDNSKPVQITISGATNWHIIVTEYASPLYPIVTN